MNTKEKSTWDSLTPEEQQEFWNGMSQSEQIAFAQVMEHPHQVQPKPDQAKGAKSRLFQQGSRPIFTYTEAMKTRAGEKKLSLYRTNFEDAGVAGDYVLPPSTGYSARMKKTVLGVVMVVVFCLTFWIVAGEAWQVAQQAEQTANQAVQAHSQACTENLKHYRGRVPKEEVYQQYSQVYTQVRNQISQKARQQAEQGYLQEYEPLVYRELNLPEPYITGLIDLRESTFMEGADRVGDAEALDIQAEKASIMADAHFRTQGSWGIGAGLLADVLILIGVLAWSKLTAKA